MISPKRYVNTKNMGSQHPVARRKPIQTACIPVIARGVELEEDYAAISVKRSKADLMQRTPIDPAISGAQGRQVWPVGRPHVPSLDMLWTGWVSQLVTATCHGVA